MKSAKILSWYSHHSVQPASAPVQAAPIEQAQLNLAETLAYPFAGLELRAYIEIRQLCAQQQRLTGESFCTLSIADLCDIFAALDDRKPSARWVGKVMKLLQSVHVVELRPSAGRSNAWRIRPQSDWLAPALWPEKRRQVYCVTKPHQAKKPRVTKKMNVLHVGTWSKNGAGDDPLESAASRIFHEIFNRVATIDFATRFLAQITEEADLQIWRKVLQWYRFRYQVGNRTPRPDTLWGMYLDWREHPHRVLDVPDPHQIGPSATASSNAKPYDKSAQNRTAIADTFSLFESEAE